MTITVIALERVPPGLRGDLSRWMLQPQTNVFVGAVSAMVRDRLWQRVTDHRATGACLMVSGAANEQGFEMRQSGDRTRALVDLEGMALVRLPPAGVEGDGEQQ